LPVYDEEMPSRAIRPCSPDAQQPPSGAQLTVSYEPVSKVRHVRPPSVDRSLPVGPTATAEEGPYGSQLTPE
jgi:hypothetical protein